jgi:hypothetical protein
MLTGGQGFAGHDVTDILAAMIRAAPHSGKLAPDMPPAVHRLLRLWFQKDPRERLPVHRERRAWRSRRREATRRAADRECRVRLNPGTPVARGNSIAPRKMDSPSCKKVRPRDAHVKRVRGDQAR